MSNINEEYTKIVGNFKLSEYAPTKRILDLIEEIQRALEIKINSTDRTVHDITVMSEAEYFSMPSHDATTVYMLY